MRWRCAVGILAVVAVACGPPVSVRRVPARQVTAELARSALNSNRPSLFSENVLFLWRLTADFERDPEAALAALHARVVGGEGGSDALFALAELCFKHADDSRRRDYYLAAVVYAYSFLFPESPADRSTELDPRVRIAADIYNRALTKGFASRDRTHVDLRSGRHALPFGQQLSVTLDEQSLVWANRQLADFVPVAELEVRGLGARFRNPGIGSPLAATMRPNDRDAAQADFVATERRIPVTALLRIDDPRRQLPRAVIESTVRVYTHYDVTEVEIGGAMKPLEAEPSATLAYYLSGSRTWAWERWGFLLGDLVSRQFEKPLAFLEPYRPGRIPVVFVYGTASSPGRWADMLNVLSNAASLNGRFQYWFFFYDTANAIPFSAMRLRETLSAVVDRIDPSGADPALRQMVVVGHSQGGLLAKMTAIESGERFWEGISTQSINDLVVSEETRDLLRRMFFFEPLSFVTRLVFIATPHGGSHVADNRLPGLIARFVRLPQSIAGAAADLITGNLDVLRFNPRRLQLGAIYDMRPGRSFVAALADARIAPGVKVHSIIPIQGDPPPEGQTDGVVRYESAHLGMAASELVIPRSDHSVQGDPLAIEEVRRILMEHADQVCRESGVACAPPRASRRSADAVPVLP